MPFSFGNIVTGNESTTPEKRISVWLGKNYTALNEKLEKVRGKAEYGVQVLWDTDTIAANLIDESPEFKMLNQATRTTSRALPSCIEKKLKIALRLETEARSDECFRTYYGA